jgi:hypothetical protein
VSRFSAETCLIRRDFIANGLSTYAVGEWIWQCVRRPGLGEPHAGIFKSSNDEDSRLASAKRLPVCSTGWSAELYGLTLAFTNFELDRTLV